MDSKLGKKMISVIVPNYNHAKFLNKRLESIFYQTYQDIEVILLDDQSTDNSPEVISSYANHPKVSHIVINEKNSGSPFYQWNKGISLAKGEFIWIAESDDWCKHTFLEKVMSKFMLHPNVGLVYTQSWKVGEDGDVICNWKDQYSPEEHHWNDDFLNSGVNELKNYFFLKNTIPNASAVVFKKSIFSPLDNKTARMRLVGDKMVWTKLLLQTDLFFISEPLNYFRTHSNNVRSTVKTIQNLYENFVWYQFLYSNVSLTIENSQKVEEWLYKWWYGACRQQDAIKYTIPIWKYSLMTNKSFGFKVICKVYIHNLFSLLTKTFKASFIRDF